MSPSPAHRLRRRPDLIFGAAALLLLPWIVVLAVTQPDRGVADNIKPLRLVLVGCIVVLGLFLVVGAPFVAGAALRAART